MNIKRAISLLLFAIINCLFIYKYGQRQNYIDYTFLIAIYAFFITGISVLFSKEKISIKYNALSSSLFWSITGIAIICFSIVIFKIDGNELKVDRWSALELTVKGILYGQYPYTELDHVGNMSSNFPALGFLAIPFYLLGDVGYLQVFTFFVFTLYLFTEKKNLKSSFVILALFIFSPAMIWEIVAKSDIVSNMMLVLLFIEYWRKRHPNKKFSNPILLGAIVSFFLLTRGTVIIPLTLFFFKDFWKTNARTKLSFITSVIITGIIICLPTLLSAPNWETLISHNPLVLQTNKAPIIAYLFLIIPFAIPYLVKNENNYHFYAAIIIFLIPFFSLITYLHQTGWNQTILHHNFDISYLSMSIPFLLFFLLKSTSRREVN